MPYEIEYNLVPKLCPECTNPIAYEKRGNKTCSRLCAALQANKNREKRSQESRDRTSLALKSFYYKKPRARKNPIIIKKECIICGVTFKPPLNKKGISSNKKTCSEECLKIVNTINCSVAGEVSANKRQLRSKKEIELFNLCKSYYINVLSNHIITDNWDADIVIPDYKTAILWNGPWHYREMGIKGVSLRQIQNRDNIKTTLFSSLGWNVITFRDDHVTPLEAFDILLETL